MTTQKADKFVPLDKRQQKALKDYQEYKKLRTIVRPVRAFDDTDAIVKDLQGEGFSSAVEEIELSKKNPIRNCPKIKTQTIAH